MTRRETVGPLWPGQTVAVALILLGLFFLLPLLFLSEEAVWAGDTAHPSATLPMLESSLSPETSGGDDPVAGWDGNQTLRVMKPDGTVETMTLADYLWGVVAAEMPASFHSEALKAQAVCARTYSLYQRSGTGDKHPGADVCTDYTCCQAYLTREQAAAGWGERGSLYADKVARAVAETDGLLCLYDGLPIDAVFFSSSAGKTSDAVTVWGSNVPYLTSVDSPEGAEVPGWQTVVTFQPQEFAARFLSACPEADFSGEASSWVRDLSADQTGLVTAVSIGGVTVSGSQVRSIFGLRSAHFTVRSDETGVTFQVTGYGHGVGMSQYGANAMAEAGKSFREILEWYYTGVTVAPWKK